MTPFAVLSSFTCMLFGKCTSWCIEHEKNNNQAQRIFHNICRDLVSNSFSLWSRKMFQFMMKQCRKRSAQSLRDVKWKNEINYLCKLQKLVKWRKKHEFKLQDYTSPSISNSLIKQFLGNKSTDIIRKSTKQTRCRNPQRM